MQTKGKLNVIVFFIGGKGLRPLIRCEVAFPEAYREQRQPVASYFRINLEMGGGKRYRVVVFLQHVDHGVRINLLVPQQGSFQVVWVGAFENTSQSGQKNWWKMR